MQSIALRRLPSFEPGRMVPTQGEGAQVVRRVHVSFKWLFPSSRPGDFSIPHRFFCPRSGDLMALPSEAHARCKESLTVTRIDRFSDR